VAVVAVNARPPLEYDGDRATALSGEDEGTRAALAGARESAACIAIADEVEAGFTPAGRGVERACALAKPAWLAGGATTASRPIPISSGFGPRDPPRTLVEPVTWA
jgi:hypothetical protein